MAQSPHENAASSDVLRYDLGWKAINDLLREGRSLSGEERNCCFLNLGSGKGVEFADVSSVLDLDFPDDGRVLALSDWDFDGDLDFWIANRSGPQIRYLRNDFREEKADFVAFYLQGTVSNRDAIGARLTVTTDAGVQSTQTLRAGEGYLSQSSKWLHFGTGDSSKIVSVRIQWPLGKVDDFGPIEAGKRYLVIEGGGGIREWKSPTIRPLKPSPLIEPPLNDQARIVLLSPLPLPELDGLTKGIQKARLINLWASWCPACPAELTEWGERVGDFDKAGLEVVAVNVDEIDDPANWTALKLPFKSQHGGEDLVRKIDVIQRAILSRQSPLPVPCSLLLDAEGNLRAIYKGPAGADQLLADCRLLEQDAASSLAAATPFPGKWVQPPGGSTPQQLVIKFLEGGFTDEASLYLKTLVADPATRSAGLLNLMGGILLDQKKFSDAANAFREALVLNPKDRKAHLELGTLLLAARKGELAEGHFSEILAMTPNDPDLLLLTGRARLFQGKLDAAGESMSQSLALGGAAGINESLSELALAFADAGQMDRAIAVMEQIKSRTPAQEDVLSEFRRKRGP